MPVGLTAFQANAFLTSLPSVWVKLYTGDPGATGGVNASTETGRRALTLLTASGGQRAMTTPNPSWTSWSAGTATISHIGIFDSVGPTGGNCLWTGSLTLSKTVSNGDTLTLTSLTFTLTPLAS